MEVITIANQKGGVGKTTTALLLAQGLVLLKNKKVLLIDIDPQGNLTQCIDRVHSDNPFTSYDLFQPQAKEKITSFIHHDNKINNLDIIPSHQNLSILAIELTQKPSSSERLRKALEGLNEQNYDYVIIDTAPALSILTLNAFMATDSVLIPVQGDVFSIQGLGQLNDTLAEVKEYGNEKLKIDGIVIVRNRKSILSDSISKKLNEIAPKLGTKTYKTIIRDTVLIKEAQASKSTIFLSNTKSIAVEDYKNFIEEFLKGERFNGKKRL